MLTLFILSYTVGAVVTYGAGFSYWQQYAPMFAKSDYKQDLRDSLIIAILWPIGISVYLYEERRKPFQSGLKFY